MISPTLIVAMVVAVLSFVGGFGVGGSRAESKLLKAQAQFAAAAAAAAADARALEAAARTEERRRTFRVQEVADAAHLQAADARSAAARADRKSVELLNAYSTVAAALSRPAADPSAAPGGPPADGSGMVFAELLRRGDTHLRSCAAALDQAHLAGVACERAYDSLTLRSTKD